MNTTFIKIIFTLLFPLSLFAVNGEEKAPGERKDTSVQDFYKGNLQSLFEVSISSRQVFPAVRQVFASCYIMSKKCIQHTPTFIKKTNEYHLKHH